MQRPKLRDGKNRIGKELYPLGIIPKNVILEISRWLVYSFAIGKSDISGEDWGDIFAKSINGEHLSSPLGLADVVNEGKAWSVKSVKHDNPHKCSEIRVISGRNSPDYSFGIENAREDIQKTGEAVLSIWNERINIALDQFDSLRTSILVRNMKSLELTLFEIGAKKLIHTDYVWSVNKRGNFEAHDKVSNKHTFTWQPHGSQFTIKYTIPASAIKFSIKRPSVFDFETTMKQIGFKDSWVEIKK